jgi:hypothetical protein
MVRVVKVIRVRIRVGVRDSAGRLLSLAQV